MKQQPDMLPEYCRIVLDSLEEGVVTIDLNRQITTFNRKAEQITGLCAQAVIGRPYRDAFSVWASDMDEMLKRTLDEKSSFLNDVEMISSPTEKPFPLAVNAGILRDADGRIIGAVQTFRALSGFVPSDAPCCRGHAFENMVSRNQKMIDIFTNLKLIADSDCTLLIEGATGTGKEMVARAVHNNSAHKNGPFVPVNCGAIPDTLIESELFGYKAGAFTDAKSDKPGRFERAHNGTIFLDEIGDISSALQVRLLRVLENKIYEPLGAIRSKDTNARVVVASHRNLDRMVRENKFREDLYFRINVMKLYLPKLADRKEDIPLLVEHFVDHFNKEKRKHIKGLSPEAMNILIGYDWPGNVRELENAIEHAFVLCREEMIDVQHLPDTLYPKNSITDSNHNLTLKEVEKIVIVQTLQKNNWQKMKTARELGINKNTLRRKIVGYGIKPDTRRKAHVGTNTTKEKRHTDRPAPGRHSAI